MLFTIKVLIIAAVLGMALLTWIGSIVPPHNSTIVFLEAAQLEPHVEMAFLRNLSRLPVKARMVVVDDGADQMRSRILEQLLIRHSGVAQVCVRPGLEKSLRSN